MPPTDNECDLRHGEIDRSLARIEKAQADQTRAMHELMRELQNLSGRLIAIETRWRFQAVIVGIVCSSVVAPIAAAITLAFLKAR